MKRVGENEDQLFTNTGRLLSVTERAVSSASWSQ
jgi:hypothetical protein